MRIWVMGDIGTIFVEIPAIDTKMHDKTFVHYKVTTKHDSDRIFQTNFIFYVKFGASP